VRDPHALTTAIIIAITATSTRRVMGRDTVTNRAATPHFPQSSQ
jgi:hypothetical protein